jgi:hypothetical protein
MLRIVHGRCTERNSLDVVPGVRHSRPCHRTTVEEEEVAVFVLTTNRTVAIPAPIGPMNRLSTRPVWNVALTGVPMHVGNRIGDAESRGSSPQGRKQFNRTPVAERLTRVSQLTVIAWGPPRSKPVTAEVESTRMVSTTPETIRNHAAVTTQNISH